jgi:hypothetical protein
MDRQDIESKAMSFKISSSGFIGGMPGSPPGGQPFLRVVSGGNSDTSPYPSLQPAGR